MREILLLLTLMISTAIPALGEVDFNASIDREVASLRLPEQDDPAGDQRGSRLWRLLGFANYLAAGNLATSQFYREERASSWDPTIDNVSARLAAHGAGVEAANEASDWLRRRGSTKQAWMARIGYFAGALYVGSANYRNGWRRR